MFYEYWGFDDWSTITTICLSVVAIPLLKKYKYPPEGAEEAL